MHFFSPSNDGFKKTSTPSNDLSIKKYHNLYKKNPLLHALDVLKKGIEFF
jgi:hypothetical protein